ncbi:MAG: hypothetical protein ABIA21_00465 [Candidatus Aenigmatarchaeota archaeon]
MQIYHRIKYKEEDSKRSLSAAQKHTIDDFNTDMVRSNRRLHNNRISVIRLGYEGRLVSVAREYIKNHTDLGLNDYRYAIIADNGDLIFTKLPWGTSNLTGRRIKISP